MTNNPAIIQGGMGVGVSGWRLARAVSQLGQLGVVSGTALDQVFARRLQDGDPGGHMRRAVDQFPFQAMAERVWRSFYVPGGKPEKASYQKLPIQLERDMRPLQEVLMVANFAEVFLAREGHGNPVGINYLEKIRIPHLASIYGAMLAGVDYILMGAGIPLKIPGILDRFVSHEPATYPLQVTGAGEGEDVILTFAPREFMEGDPPNLKRPRFLAIIASNVLAVTMLKKANGRVDGFVIEAPVAGGHNAPPRGKLQLNDTGEPVYGKRDVVDLAKMRELGVPFWLAGGYATPEKLREAKAEGAAGIQAGTAFAFCEESSLRDDYKRTLLKAAVAGRARVFTDPLASPTGFPFKVALLENTLSDRAVYEARPRICDLGYLREAWRTPTGEVDYRCPGEPETTFAAKGGRQEDAPGRKCLCNALLANIGHPQVRNGKHIEQGLITAGDDLGGIGRFLPSDRTSYRAADVVATLLSDGPLGAVSNRTDLPVLR